ncbi:MAG: tyrosine-type recombinase/integrase [Candidatus Aminicenantes bacterium]|nr:tyrosine-type recombinase/integrase [Candidatus Aminicenantes bacterium]
MTKLRHRMIEDMHLHGLSENTQDSYLMSVTILAKHYWRSPDKITEHEIRQFFLYLMDEKKSSRATIATYYYGIKFFYEKTLGRKWRIFDIVKPRKKYQLPVILNIKEIKAMIDEIKSPIFRMCFILLYCCGLRLSEGVHLTIGDVDMERKQIRVRGKGNKIRYVPIPDQPHKFLEQYIREHNPEHWLFLSSRTEKPIHTRSVQRLVKQVLKKAGINKQAYPHSLRHSYATHLLESGVSIKLIQLLLGHKSIQTTNRYTQITQISLTALGNALNKIMIQL